MTAWRIGSRTPESRITEGVLMAEWWKGNDVLALRFGLPVQADIQNALDKGFIGHAGAFGRLG